MQDRFQELIKRLSRIPEMPAAVATATCPSSPRQIVPKLLDMGVSAKVLTQALSEVFAYPVYSPHRHGEFSHACAHAHWGYARGVLFVACPFDDSLQAAGLLPAGAYREFTGFGLLPVSGERGTAADDYDRVQAEKVICRWLDRAVAQAATDLHIAPLTTKYVRVRARVDGQLRTLDELPMHGEETNYRFISNMLLKLMNCATGSFIRPVDGRFVYPVGGRRVEVRATMRPVNVQGISSQAFYLRFSGLRGGHLKSLSSLGFSDRTQAVFSEVRQLNQGLVLITGPTGSGKSTTLYANLVQIVGADPWRSVQTLEDPVEIDIRGIEQTQINEDAGIGFQDGLRALMRSDVDVILVGEIRDQETARLAVRASLTGHLVFATVHARDGLSAVERMLDLNVNAKALALVLTAVFAQRLVRRVCAHCSGEVTFSEYREREPYAGLFAASDVLKVANTRGCEACDQGYRGRRVVIECIRVGRDLARAIAAGESILEMEKLIVREGGETLRQNAAALIRHGETTLAECQRHLSLHSEPPHCASAA